MHRFRRLAVGVTPLLFIVFPLLAPMAYASPPDPSWIHGLYDEGDFDEVAVIVTSGVGIVELAPLADVSPAPPTTFWPVRYSDAFVSTEWTSSLVFARGRFRILTAECHGPGAGSGA